MSVSPRISATGSNQTIKSGLDTWIVIHGRGGHASDFTALAKQIDNFSTSDQVLVLDWSSGAANNTPSLTGLQGASWTPSVGLWLSQALGRMGVTGSKVHLVGHSWGTYVAYEAAKRISGGVNSIVALDPAYGGSGVSLVGLTYPASSVNFASVSSFSWSFYGSDSFGDNVLAGTADESFDVFYSGSSLVLSTSAHSEPIAVFTFLVQQNYGLAKGKKPSGQASVFNLNNLIHAKKGPWKPNAFAARSALQSNAKVFEGQFTVPSKGLGNPSQFAYFPSAGGAEKVLV